MRAFVLSAGLGSRLSPLTAGRPKPTVPVANRPLAWFALDHLARSGVSDVTLNAHYHAEELLPRLRDFIPASQKVSVVVEPELLGTGGGVKNMWRDDGEPVFVTNSDIVFAPDYAGALAVHQTHGAIATMVLRPDPNVARYGSLGVDAEGRVRRLLGDPIASLDDYMFTGVHVLSPRARRDLPDAGCIVARAYRKWIDEGEVVAAHIDRSPWRDLGTKEAYLQANLDFVSGALTWPSIDPAALSAGHAGCVVGDAEILAPIERCVIWNGARVTEPLSNAVVTPERVVVV